ncbi:MAG: radical SAM family heme chaperone HemW [Synechococcales bacterium]|nr:radical SAM family heme chaperone HemW [Synechococcales bacterium]
MLLPQAAYVHIPFCRRRCFYCDFPISVLGDRRAGNQSGTILQYVEILCQEIQLTSVADIAGAGSPLTSIFFGGGTPSLLSVEQLGQIVDCLDRHFGIAPGAELAMEIDPGTFDRAQIQGYQAVGINRVSLGVQAFQSHLLEACGRTHRVEEVYEAVNLIQRSGIGNYSLDLISGLPTQTIADWQESLQAAIALQPTHLSTYDLTLETGTVFGKRYQPGDQPLPTDEQAADMYRIAAQVLRQAGYDHYEISNYAKPGYQCRHNRVYWENRPFYGFGMGATSYLGDDRVARPRNRQDYYAWVKDLEVQSRSPVPSRVEPVAEASIETLLETLMVGLRLAEGVAIAPLLERYGPVWLQRVWHCLQPYGQQGWVTWRDDRHGAWAGQMPTQALPLELPPQGRIAFTDPEGFLFSNVVLVRLFEQLEKTDRILL